MYAVIKTGGKQYRVSPGDQIEVEHLKLKSDSTTFAPLLVVTDEGETISGADNLKGYSVSAKLLGDSKGDKITVFKYRPKSGYASKTGHRQLYSLLEITSIGAAQD
ncbi:MAG TPA: 50S ribosomal protein L21 [Actinomycetota bacterium]|nr:50S ribosomal protein L21 [Actinomycetota bacterium]